MSQFSTESECPTNDMICFSHLRWKFVLQRPQHLMRRFARSRRLYYIEEPGFEPAARPYLEIEEKPEGVRVVVPFLPAGLSEEQSHATLRDLITDLVQTEDLQDLTLWYYNPSFLPFTSHIEAKTVIYDCMDELSLFKVAANNICELERDLFARAHLAFTGGHSLYEAKCHLHNNIYPAPSSIDFDHFALARKLREQISKSLAEEPADQAGIPGPRIGFFGVVDERFNIHLLREMARLRPEWQFVIVGPVVKIDPATLPEGSNIHYLGKKEYSELPHYIAGWSAAILPFALNDSTRFISPTKTPEYLAAGLPVVSTSIRDVIRPYAELGLVEIADEPDAFARALEYAMSASQLDRDWLARVDGFLSEMSWDLTFARMAQLERQIGFAAPEILAPWAHEVWKV